MNLIELFDLLYSPEESKGKCFNAVPIPNYENFRIAIDVGGNPILLLSVVEIVKSISLKNFRLQYLQLEQNITCKISENGISGFKTFTVITFLSTDRNLQEYFLRISETLVKTLGAKPSQEQIVISLNKFVEVFRAITDVPTKTVRGLWAELFLIDYSSNPLLLLEYWHNVPEEKFDFNSGKEQIEVKSNANFERIHVFSSEQLNPISETQVLVASVFIRQNNWGLTIQEIADRIAGKIQYNYELVDKLYGTIFKTLGCTLEESGGMKFDYRIAKESLRFYKHQDIKKIEKLHIPNEVYDVKYKVDLSTLLPIEIESFSPKGILFDGI